MESLAGGLEERMKQVMFLVREKVRLLEILDRDPHLKYSREKAGG